MAAVAQGTKRIGAKRMGVYSSKFVSAPTHSRRPSPLLWAVDADGHR